MAKNPSQQQNVITTANRDASLDDFRAMTRVLNAIKNERRIHILQLLYEKLQTGKEMQDGLRSMGNKHSLTTIYEYLRPLFEAELVRYNREGYAVTDRGAKVVQLLDETDFLLGFPRNSSCHEEFSLIAIKNGYRTFEDLAKLIDRSVLPRTISRLQRAGLVESKHPRDHVQFCRIRMRLLGEISPTERRVFHAIGEGWVSVRDLSKAVEITIRRTYKYLARLKKKGLVLQRNPSVTYALTPTGRTGAEVIEEMLARAFDRPRHAILSAPVDYRELGVKVSLAMIQRYGGNGILQCDLWRRLGIDSRKGSKEVLKLQRRGFIERRRERSRGGWTFRIFPRRRTGTIDTIADIPCASCDDDYKGGCPTHALNPATCSRLTNWVIDVSEEIPYRKKRSPRHLLDVGSTRLGPHCPRPPDARSTPGRIPLTLIRKVH